LHDDLRRTWHKPKVSRRRANVLRKRAIRDGTYGTFSIDTWEGWDPAWDSGLFHQRRSPRAPAVAKGIEPGGGALSATEGEDDDDDRRPTDSDGGWCRYRVAVPKTTRRQRTREDRAKAIDRNLADMDRKIEEHHAARHASKPPDTFENRYKKLMRVKK
jgi:hypothetical protein